ncbi:hypothetical protein D3C73_1290290 [compost metagenome]
MFDPQQRGDKTVAASLVQHTFTCINQQDRQIACGCTGGHVPGVLLMPWRIGDNKFAFLRGEIAVGHVDGDALLTLGL